VFVVTNRILVATGHEISIVTAMTLFKKRRSTAAMRQARTAQSGRVSGHACHDTDVPTRPGVPVAGRIAAG
jgi:hypothetical protein